MFYKKKNYLLPFIVLLIAGITYLYWAYKIPLYNAPDEFMRYQIPKFMFDFGRLPTGYDKEAIYTLGNWSYAFYPQFLGAFVSSIFMKVLSIFNNSEFALLYFARLSSVLFGLITIFFTGLSIEKITKSKLYMSLGMTLIAFLPQFTFLSSYVNNDIIGAAGASIIVYAMVSSYYDLWNKKNSLILAFGFIVCGLGYLNSYGFMLAGGLYFILSNIVNLKTEKITKSEFSTNFFLIFIVTAFAIFPFLIRNYILYKDVFGMNVFHDEYVRWLNDGGIILQKPYDGSLTDILQDSYVISLNFHSFVGMFGYMNIMLSNKLYLLYMLIFVVGVVGSILKALVKTNFKKVMVNWNKVLLVLFVVTGCLITIVLQLYYCLVIDNQPQGR